MAEKKKYNSILISGRKDETLTYSKYVKDEESGESVKESLDKKVNVTDELTTQQIKDGAITKDKLQDKTIGVEKLDNELRQTIAAATGLPEDLVETIQNVDDTLKDHQSQLDDKQQQITANDEDISLLQTRSTQMEETIKSIAATGGASQATAVTYDNANSQLSAINIQSAVDELQGSKIDKTSILQESGEAEDKVMSQKVVSDKFSDLKQDSVILSFGNRHEEIASKMKEHGNCFVINDSGDVVFTGVGNMYIMKANISNYDVIKVVANKAGDETQYTYAIYNSYSIFDNTTFLFGSINNGIVDITQLDGAKTMLVSTTDKNIKVTAFAHVESSSLLRINKVQDFAITKDNSIAIVEFDGEFKPYDQMIALFYCKNKGAHVTNLALKTSDGTFYRSANNQIAANSEGYVIIDLEYNKVIRKGNFFLVSEGYTMGISDSIEITNLRIFKVNQNPIGATLTDKFKNLITTVSKYANQAYGLYENGYINCIGDSLTAGTGGKPYSVHLNKMLDTKYNGRFFCNMLAVGGENTTTILGRVSAMPYQLAESIILPANTDKVEAHLISSWNGSNVTPLIQGDVGIQFIIINGIKCKLSLDNKKYYINRIDNGSTPITLPQGEVITTQAFYQSRYPYANIIWIGTNGGWKDADDLVEQINTVVNTYRSKEYCVLGIHFTAYKDKWSILESSMRRKFGSHFCNSRLYLSTNAMYDLELTPTNEDLSAMNNGECPPSLMSDGVHLNDNGYKAIATLIYRNIFGNRTLTE